MSNESEGMVGIFWVDRTDKVVSLAEPVSQTKGRYGILIGAPIGHRSSWHRVQHRLDGAEFLRFDQVRRGRILYNEEQDVFCVRVGWKDGDDKDVMDQISQHFNLDGKKVRKRFDLAYSVRDHVVDEEEIVKETVR